MKKFSWALARRRLGRLIAEHEKVLLALLSVVIVLSGSVWFRQYAASHSSDPAAGGSYVEGIVGDINTAQLLAAKVTRTGLFTISSSGELRNQLVDNWTANPEKTEYTFRLKEGIDTDGVVNDLNENVQLLGQATIESSEASQLKISLSQPNPSLPLLLTQPIFAYGPYKVSKTTDKTTVLTRSTAPNAAPAYLNKIIIHTFGTQAEVDKALAQGKIDGTMLVDGTDPAAKTSRQTLNLPRYYVVVFNSNKSPFRDLATRQKLLQSQSAAASFALTVPNEEPYLGLAQTLVNEWTALGAKVTLDPQPLSDVTRKIGPSRDFQAILTGVDYGGDLDPYYLWHSTQIRPPGNNIAGVQSPVIDALIDQIQATLNVTERQKLIGQLHETLPTAGVARILKQETASIALSDQVRYQLPWLPLSSRDYWLAIPQWSVK